MSAYNSLDGDPCSCNRWLLTDVLRKEWGFKGFVVSDYGSISGIHTLHKTAETKADAARQAIDAGLDMELPFSDCFEELFDLVEKKKISEKVIDASVRRILRAKFWLGLFDNCYADPKQSEEICNCKEHRELALEAARQSIILLKDVTLILMTHGNFQLSCIKFKPIIW